MDLKVPTQVLSLERPVLTLTFMVTDLLPLVTSRMGPWTEMVASRCNCAIQGDELRREALNPVAPNKGVCPLFVTRSAKHLLQILLSSLHRRDETAVTAVLNLTETAPRESRSTFCHAKTVGGSVPSSGLRAHF
ncbi:unnamed protein product [Pleuronectes platessa]|uniref:Uncharacterized protein n=1 Tax=Pleuronectes platessa TaxID=8262 RepID=A0A9N7UCQ5_PLEPL|nr:unnamed protein product [Pleuronectes platessa]